MGFIDSFMKKTGLGGNDENYDNEPDYAGSIGVATTLVCILTMPLIVHIYQM